jgi:hypothetical protein
MRQRQAASDLGLDAAQGFQHRALARRGIQAGQLSDRRLQKRAFSA